MASFHYNFMMNKVDNENIKFHLLMICKSRRYCFTKIRFVPNVNIHNIGSAPTPTSVRWRREGDFFIWIFWRAQTRSVPANYTQVASLLYFFYYIFFFLGWLELAATEQLLVRRSVIRACLLKLQFVDYILCIFIIIYVNFNRAFNRTPL